MNGFTFVTSSSEMPSITNPWSLNRSYRLSISGISLRQGGHQVAQKLTNTTLPPRSLSVQLCPCKSFNVKFAPLRCSSSESIFDNAAVNCKLSKYTWNYY